MVLIPVLGMIHPLETELFAEAGRTKVWTVKGWASEDPVDEVVGKSGAEEDGEPDEVWCLGHG